MKQVLRAVGDSRTPACGIAADVSDTHKARMVHPEDWPLQACQVRDVGDVFIHMCGTYGISSAGDWWGRLLAAAVGMVVYILGHELPASVLLYANDRMFISQGDGLRAFVGNDCGRLVGTHTLCGSH